MDNLSFSGQYLRVSSTTTSVDEFQIRHTTYKIAIKLELESGPLYFTTAYTKNPDNPAPIYCTRRSVDLSCKDSKVYGRNEGASHFTFYFQLEKDNKKEKMETCTLYLKRTATVKDSPTLLKHAVNVQCPCTLADNNNEDDDQHKKINRITDPYPDCIKADMVDFNQRSCLRLGKHAHDSKHHGLAQEYLITITEFDFSEALVVPYEAQKILARRAFENEVKGTQGAYFDEIRKPFDVTIICKDGLEIDVHAYILSTRNHVFRKMLSANIKLSGRGSSFRKLAKEAFIKASKVERNKKSKTVTIDESEISSVAMEVILHFIYFGELQNNWKVDLIGVLHGARKYGLKLLLDFLDGLLITLCKRKNALHLLKLAERYSLKGAETAIRDYIFTNLGGILQESVKITSV